MKLIRIEQSKVPGKKYSAYFLSDAGPMLIHFGAKGYKDYTMYPAEIREAKKDAYIKRHQVREDWTKPYTAGTLSRYILWNKPTIKASITDYKRRFNL